MARPPAPRIPLARFGVPEELVSAALFLSSDASGFMTGPTSWSKADGPWHERRREHLGVGAHGPRDATNAARPSTAQPATPYGESIGFVWSGRYADRTAHGPLDDLEIVEVLGAVYVETGMKASCVPVASLDAEAFLPLALGRSDYWPALVTARLPEPAAAR